MDFQKKDETVDERLGFQKKIWGRFAARHGIKDEESYVIGQLERILSEITSGGVTTFGPELTGDPNPAHTKISIRFNENGSLKEDQLHAIELLKVLDFDTTIISTASTTREGQLVTHHQVLAVEKIKVVE